MLGVTIILDIATPGWIGKTETETEFLHDARLVQRVEALGLFQHFVVCDFLGPRRGYERMCLSPLDAFKGFTGIEPCGDGASCSFDGCDCGAGRLRDHEV